MPKLRIILIYAKPFGSLIELKLLKTPLFTVPAFHCVEQKLPATLYGQVLAFAGLHGSVEDWLANDVIWLKTGDGIHSVSILHCVHQEPSVRNVQLQVGDDGFELSLVAPDVDRFPLESRIRQRLVQVHADLATTRFTYVEDVEVSRAGKRPWFIDKRTQKITAPTGRLAE